MGGRGHGAKRRGRRRRHFLDDIFVERDLLVVVDGGRRRRRPRRGGRWRPGRGWSRPRRRSARDRSRCARGRWARNRRLSRWRRRSRGCRRRGHRRWGRRPRRIRRRRFRRRAARHRRSRHHHRAPASSGGDGGPCRWRRGRWACGGRPRPHGRASGRGNDRFRLWIRQDGLDMLDQLGAVERLRHVSVRAYGHGLCRIDGNGPAEEQHRNVLERRIRPNALA